MIAAVSVLLIGITLAVVLVVQRAWDYRAAS
jgi:hypothetical protein